MPNMSYCRFQNTLTDFVDCARALERIAYDGESISEAEKKAAKDLRSWCVTFLDTFEDWEESLNEEDDED